MLWFCSQVACLILLHLHAMAGGTESYSSRAEDAGHSLGRVVEAHPDSLTSQWPQATRRGAHTEESSSITRPAPALQAETQPQALKRTHYMGLPGGSGSEESACNAGNLGSIPGSGRSPGEGNGYPLAWSIPWTEEPGGLQSMGSQRVRHDRATKHACIPLRGESYSFLLNSPCWVNHSVSLDYSYLICKMMTKPNRLCCYED